MNSLNNDWFSPSIMQMGFKKASRPFIYCRSVYELCSNSFFDKAYFTLHHSLPLNQPEQWKFKLFLSARQGRSRLELLEPFLGNIISQSNRAKDYFGVPYRGKIGQAQTQSHAHTRTQSESHPGGNGKANGTASTIEFASSQRQVTCRTLAIASAIASRPGRLYRTWHEMERTRADTHTPEAMANGWRG